MSRLALASLLLLSSSIASANSRLTLPSSKVPTAPRWEHRPWIEVKAAAVIGGLSLATAAGWEGFAVAAAATVLATWKLRARPIAPMAAPLAAAVPSPGAARGLSAEERQARDVVFEELRALRFDTASLSDADLAAAFDRLGEPVDPRQFKRGQLRVIDEVGVINKTEFFRDSPTWNELRRRLEPMLAGRAARGERSLVLKSVGGSDGSEAYSLAMLADDLLRARGEDPGRWDVRIEVYDFNPTNSVLAALGYYHRPPRDWEHYFEAGPGKWRRIRPELRAWIYPRRLDLRSPSDWERLAERPGQALLLRYVQPYLDAGVLTPLYGWLRAGRWTAPGGALFVHTPWRRGLFLNEAAEAVEVL
ncbi:MAG: hypothetical protein HY553_15510 [Elusimicrobia bacterium]|nr:hypothetical protein [Elusimicrobiota bacterium]